MGVTNQRNQQKPGFWHRDWWWVIGDGCLGMRSDGLILVCEHDWNRFQLLYLVVTAYNINNVEQKRWHPLCNLSVGRYHQRYMLLWALLMQRGPKHSTPRSPGGKQLDSFGVPDCLMDHGSPLLESPVSCFTFDGRDMKEIASWAIGHLACSTIRNMNTSMVKVCSLYLS